MQNDEPIKQEDANALEKSLNNLILTVNESIDEIEIELVA